MDLPALSERKEIEGVLVEGQGDQEMLRHLFRYIAYQTSGSTQKTYSRDIRQFLGWRRERFGMRHLEELSRFTDDHAALYLNHLLRQGKPATVCRKLLALSQLF